MHTFQDIANAYFFIFLGPRFITVGEDRHKCEMGKGEEMMVKLNWRCKVNT